MIFNTRMHPLKLFWIVLIQCGGRNSVFFHFYSSNLLKFIRKTI
jgi:hypothetical protein